MKHPLHRLTAPFAALLVALFGALPFLPAQTVTNNLYFHLGEADLGAAAGDTITSTVESIIDYETSNTGVVYTSDTPGAISSLAASFGGNGYIDGPNILLSPDSSFALEAWIKPASIVDTTAAVFYNGKTGGSGIGLYQFDNKFGVLAGGKWLQTATATLNADEWTNIAAVWDFGTLTLYQNGANVGTFTSGDFGNVPLSSSFLTIGAGYNDSVVNQFSGSIDEVRLFTWTGSFDTTMLNYPASAIPEPATTTVLAGAGVLCLAAWRRRRSLRN
jgi:hypothetical protein